MKSQEMEPEDINSTQDYLDYLDKLFHERERLLWNRHVRPRDCLQGQHQKEEPVLQWVG